MLHKLVNFHHQVVFLPTLFNIDFNISCLAISWRHDIWISKKLKYDYLKNKKSFRSSINLFFLVLKVLLFRQTKKNSKNIADKTSQACVFLCFLFFFFTKWQPLNKGFYFISKALFIVNIFKFSYFRLPLIFYMPFIGLEHDER